MGIEINKNVFSNFPTLESQRLKFREIIITDSKKLFEIRTNDEVMKYMDTSKMQSISDANKLIESIQDSYVKGEGINWGIIEKKTNRFIGYFGFWRIDVNHCRGEIGYALHPDYWGQGYMQETLDVLIRFGFSEINLHSVEANVNPDNKDSIKLLERNKFKQEAYFRENFLFNDEFKDSQIYSLLESDLNEK